MRISFLVLILLTAGVYRGMSQKVNTYDQTYGQELDDFFQRQLENWDLPGFAVGIVKDGEVIFAGGYGYANIAAQIEATPATIFRISSITKSFTALGIGTLVKDSLLNLDEPIISYYPSFRMKESYKNDLITLRDLLSHQTGLPRHDILWFFPKRNLTSDQLYANLRFLDSNISFRQAYQYNNIMFSLAAHVGEKVSGNNWLRLLDNRVIRPLGMQSTCWEFQDEEIFARGYVKKSGEVEVVPVGALKLDLIGAAGNLFSTVDDMNKYMLFLLQATKEKSNDMVDQPYLTQMMSSQVSQRVPSFASYGLGLRLVSYEGTRIVWHAGASTGYSSLFTIIPEEQIGIVILSNAGFRNPSTSIIRNTIIDQMLEIDGPDWEKVIGEGFLRRQKEEAEDEPENQIPARELGHYLGEFTHPAYGEVVVSTNGSQLLLSLNGNSNFTVSHKTADTFSAMHNIREDVNFPMTFSFDDQGIIQHVKIPFEELVDPIVFTRSSN